MSWVEVDLGGIREKNEDEDDQNTSYVWIKFSK